MATKGRIISMTKKAAAEEKEFSGSGIESDKSDTSDQSEKPITSDQSEKPITGETVLAILREKGVRI